MTDRHYNSYAEWYSEGPFADYIRASGMAGDAMSVIEATQPAGDLSDPPINDLVLIRMMVSDIPCDIDLGAGMISASQQYGDFILVSPNVRSNIQMHAPHAVQLFSLPAANCLALMGSDRARGLDFGQLHSRLFRSDLLNALCQRLVDASRLPTPSSRLFVDGALMALLGELSLLAGSEPVQRQRFEAGDWRIRRTLEQIEAKLGEDWELADLAASVGLSPSRYNHVFRAATGLSPHAWVIKRKIERACQLLLNPGTPITEIALSLGFSSSQHFATTFRTQKGLPPSEWRREKLR